MRLRTPRPAIFDRPSNKVMAAAALAAVTLGIVFFPFVFDAFGGDDTPFEKPIELFWIALLSAGFVPVIATIVLARRAVLKLFSA